MIVKITGIDLKGLNIQQLEALLKDKLKSVVRIIGVSEPEAPPPN